MKRILLLLMILLCAAGIVSAADPLWDNHGTAELVKKAYETLRSAYQSNPTYENAWQFARAAHYYASVIIDDADKEKQKAVFTEGKDAATKAMELNPNGVEGYYYFAICLGSWAETNGIMSSLFAVKPMLEAIEKAIAINPAFEDASPLMTRGRLYQKAPGRPISIGDKKKSQADYEEAIRLGPENRVAFRFYAEFLIDLKDKAKAAEIIRRGLAIPFDNNNAPQENLEIAKLKELQAQLK
jgi:tetratricopeptide (TPR) repeat protein